MEYTYLISFWFQQKEGSPMCPGRVIPTLDYKIDSREKILSIEKALKMKNGCYKLILNTVSLLNASELEAGAIHENEAD